MLLRRINHALNDGTPLAFKEDLVWYLAELLTCPRGAVAILRGHASRRMVVRVTGIPCEKAGAILAKYGGSSK